MSVSANGLSEVVEACFVSGNYFDVLGVPPAAGRVISPNDDRRNGPVPGVISHTWWQTRFGGDRSVVGSTIRVNAVPVTIIGVAARGFQGTSLTEPAKLFIPVTTAPRVRTGFFAKPEMLDLRSLSWLTVIGRLRPGVAPRGGGGHAGCDVSPVPKALTSRRRRAAGARDAQGTGAWRFERPNGRAIRDAACRASSRSRC